MGRGSRSLAAMSGRGLIALAASALAAPGLAQWQSDLGACARASLSPEQRIEACSRTLRADGVPAPDRATAYNNLGVAWKAKGDLDQAIPNYDRAIALAPRLANVYNNRCNTWLIKEAYDQAAADCTVALKLDPELAQAHFNRGVLWVVANDFAKAKVEFDEAIRLKPEFAPAYKSRATLNFYSGQ